MRILLRLVLLAEMVDLLDDAFLPSKNPKVFIPSSSLLTAIYTLYSRTPVPQLSSNHCHYHCNYRWPRPPDPFVSLPLIDYTRTIGILPDINSAVSVFQTSGILSL